MKDLGACIRHPGEPALFRCRQCHDAVCVGCRAPDERDLCATCAQYRSDSATREARVLAGETPDEVPRRIPWERYVIALLVVLNIGLAVVATHARLLKKSYAHPSRTLMRTRHPMSGFSAAC